MSRAFTLVELLVVLSIMAILMGMVMTSQGRLGREAQVAAAARRFAGVCAQARAQAMADNAPYAIAINIQNQPGSSGRVLNNRSGGHWYRLAGPREHSVASAFAKTLLIGYPDSSELGSNDSQTIRTFPEVVEALKATWRGPQFQLPAGKVRFLALGDTDEGARVNGGNQNTTATRAKSYGYAPTYPRPWFGYFDTARGRLFPWGGYDHQLGLDEPWKKLDGSGAVTNYTGFFYEGADGAVLGCRNPITRTYNNDWNRDLDFADTDLLRGPETGYQVLVAGEPRPLVSADWQDFLVVFRPDGQVYCPPFKTNRKRFKNVQSVPTGSYVAANAGTWYANGVSDTTKPWLPLSGVSTLDTAFNYRAVNRPTSWAAFSEAAEVGHFVRNCGYYSITFAPDSPDDRDEFPTAAEAIASMSPMYRVQLSVQGAIQVLRVDVRNDSALAALNPLPSSPSYWTDTSMAAGALLAQEMRWGFLQRSLKANGAAWTDADNITNAVPRGRPIADVLTPRMLTGKIWWSDD
jgi:prepilin-type N-terminal cleavage/methylation domain-containing protein